MSHDNNSQDNELLSESEKKRLRKVLTEFVGHPLEWSELDNYEEVSDQESK